jgi:hypothetical protein
VRTEQQLEATYARLIEASFVAFAIDYRKRIGRPLSSREWALAKLAHGYGFTTGVDEGARALCEGEEAG